MALSVSIAKLINIYSYKSGSRTVYQCKACLKNYRLTAGTLFHPTKVSLHKWFLTFQQIIQSKNSVSALELHHICTY